MRDLLIIETLGKNCEGLNHWLFLSVKVSERGDFIHPAPRTNLSPTPPIQAIDTRARNKEN